MKTHIETLVFKESVQILIKEHGYSKKEAEKLMNDKFECIQEAIQKNFATKKKFLD